MEGRTGDGMRLMTHILALSTICLTLLACGPQNGRGPSRGQTPPPGSEIGQGAQRIQARLGQPNAPAAIGDHPTPPPPPPQEDIWIDNSTQSRDVLVQRLSDSGWEKVDRAAEASTVGPPEAGGVNQTAIRSPRELIKNVFLRPNFVEQTISATLIYRELDDQTREYREHTTVLQGRFESNWNNSGYDVAEMRPEPANEYLERRFLFLARCADLASCDPLTFEIHFRTSTDGTDFQVWNFRTEQQVAAERAELAEYRSACPPGEPCEVIEDTFYDVNQTINRELLRTKTDRLDPIEVNAREPDPTRPQIEEPTERRDPAPAGHFWQRRPNEILGLVFRAVEGLREILSTALLDRLIPQADRIEGQGDRLFAQQRSIAVGRRNTQTGRLVHLEDLSADASLDITLNRRYFACKANDSEPEYYGARSVINLIKSSCELLDVDDDSATAHPRIIITRVSTVNGGRQDQGNTHRNGLDMDVDFQPNSTSAQALLIWRFINLLEAFSRTQSTDHFGDPMIASDTRPAIGFMYLSRARKNQICRAVKQARGHVNLTEVERYLLRSILINEDHNDHLHIGFNCPKTNRIDQGTGESQRCVANSPISTPWTGSNPTGCEGIWAETP